MSKNDPYARATEAALARLEAAEAGGADPADRLIAAINKRRAHGDAPDVTTSFASASARAAWRQKSWDLDTAVEDAAGAYAADADVDTDALAENIAAAMALPADVTVAWAEPDEYDEDDEDEL